MKPMASIIIKPKTLEERLFLMDLLKRMNITSTLVEEPEINYETKKAIKDVVDGKVNKVSNSDQLFDELEI